MNVFICSWLLCLLLPSPRTWLAVLFFIIIIISYSCFQATYIILRLQEGSEAKCWFLLHSMPPGAINWEDVGIFFLSALIFVCSWFLSLPTWMVRMDCFFQPSTVGLKTPTKVPECFWLLVFIVPLWFTPLLLSSISIPHLQWTCWTSAWLRTLSNSTNSLTTVSCCPSPTSSTAWHPSTMAWSRSTKTLSTCHSALTCVLTGFSMFMTRAWDPSTRQQFF